MENIIIIAVLIFAAVFAAKSAFGRLKGGSGGCGGGGYKVKRKKLSSVRYKKVFKVDGMHCEHCKARVEEAVNDISGVSGSVDLKKGILTVAYAENVSDETVIKQIERAGYTVTKIFMDNADK